MDDNLFSSCLIAAASMQYHPDTLVPPKDVVDYATELYREVKKRPDLVVYREIET